MSPALTLSVGYYPGDDTMTAVIERCENDTIEKVFIATVNKAAACGGMCQLGGLLTQMMERQVANMRSTPQDLPGPVPYIGPK